MRARHDHAAIDVEALPGEPGFVQQIRRRDALLDSPRDQRFDFCGIGSAAGVRVERQSQATQHEEGGFVARVVRAVAVVQARSAEPALGFPDQLSELQGSRARSVSR